MPKKITVELPESVAEKLYDYRHFFIDRNKTRRGDRFLSLWIEFKLLAGQGIGKRNAGRAKKFYEKFFADKELRRILEPVANVDEIMFAQLIDSAEVYMRACKEDRQYGSKLFALMRMKDEEIAVKAANDVYDSIVQLLLILPRDDMRDRLIFAIHHAYQTVFDEYAIGAEQYYARAEDVLEAFREAVAIEEYPVLEGGPFSTNV